MSKVEDYAGLVAVRTTCRLCSELVNPADVENGRYDSSEIGPWSRWQGNLNAKLMVVGQDWGDTGYFVRNEGVESLGNRTNVTLMDLIGTLGLTIGPPGAMMGQDVVFFTNAILCLKEGGLQAQVQENWFRNCAPHLRRQIEIVQANIVVGLGERAFRAILLGFNLLSRSFRSEVEDPEGTLLPNGSRAFAVYHCGARIQNTHRKLDAQERDWARMRRFLTEAG